jgi:peptidoglycan-associated lipoprotein
MSTRVLLAAACVVVAVGCAHKRPETQTEYTSAHVKRSPHEVQVSDEIRRICKIEEPKNMPKFDFDSADISAGDREVLSQVARCLTTGPLKGRSIELVGRADPRGESEYNMVLGESRAGSVNKYLAALGVDLAKMAVSSRGELDATGVDEDSWQLDRRVDVRLTNAAVSTR